MASYQKLILDTEVLLFLSEKVFTDMSKRTVGHIMLTTREVSQNNLHNDLSCSVADMCLEYILPNDNAEQERLGKLVMPWHTVYLM